MAKKKEKSNELIKKHFVLGCCGIDCGLCPRFYTEGESRCPGCGGPNFNEKHPSCSILNCCFKKKNLESCGLCNEFPCNKYDNYSIKEKDSFVTHRKIYSNHSFIKENGLKIYLKEQKIRIKLLKLLLEKYNDNKSKNYYCLAATLLSIKNIENILMYLKNNRDVDIKTLKEKINECSKEENIELRLNK